MRITLTLLDGRTFDAEANAATFGCLADRVAFERRFGQSAAILGRITEFVEDGEVIDSAGLADALREEHLLFLAWRELQRQCPDLPEFDDVLVGAVALGMHGGVEPGETQAVAEDPSSPTAV